MHKKKQKHVFTEKYFMTVTRQFVSYKNATQNFLFAELSFSFQEKAIELHASLKTILHFSIVTDSVNLLLRFFFFLFK